MSPLHIVLDVYRFDGGCGKWILAGDLDVVVDGSIREGGVVMGLCLPDSLKSEFPELWLSLGNK